jgi:hypothetical protein
VCPPVFLVRYAIIAHVVHLVNRDYQAMCKDYYTLQVSCDLAGHFTGIIKSGMSS